MKSLTGMLLAFVLIAFSFASVVTLARGAPTKDQAFTRQAVVAEAPVIAEQPSALSVAYQNEAAPRVANAVHVYTVTTEQKRQSTTVGWRSINANQSGASYVLRAPCVVLLA